MKTLLILTISLLLATSLSAAGPTWTKIGNLTSDTSIQQPWSAVFDSHQILYVAGNQPTYGGIARSADHGLHWTNLTPTGTTSKGFRLVSKTQDGTIIAIQQAGSGGVIKAFWLNNVSGNGLTWTPATFPSNVSGGGELGCAITPNGSATVCPMEASTLVYSTNNGRSWTVVSNPPPASLVAEELQILTIGNYMYLGLAIHSGIDNPCCTSNSGEFWYSTDGQHWYTLGWPSNMQGCTLQGTKTCSLDAGMAMFKGIGTNAGKFCGYFGGTGNVTGMYCYNGTPGSGGWVFAGTNEWASNCPSAGHCGMSEAMWDCVVDNTADSVVCAYYQDAGFPLISSTDGTSWFRADTGMTCTSNCGTYGGLKATMGILDPSTGKMLWFIKDGSVYQTTTSQ